MNILGINEALGASAAILKDGEIVAASLEERFTRIKNYWGYPKKAINFCCDYAGIKPDKMDLVVLSYTDPYPHFTINRAQETKSATPKFLTRLRDVAPQLEYRFPFINPITDLGRLIYYNYFAQINERLQAQAIAGFLNISPDKIIRANHHLIHAYTAYYSNPYKSNPTLVLTCDGAGDKLCATIYQVINGKFNLLAKSLHLHSLGLFYAAVTAFLGLNAHEDEYKVMGLAPYAKTGTWHDIYSMFKQLIWVDRLEFKSKIPSRHFDFFLNENLRRVRFDYIAAAAQQFFEDTLLTWIKNAVNQTRVRNVVVAGGVFLNVKANQKITKLKEIKTVYFTPSPGDDTNAFGACYFGYKQLQPKFIPKPLAHLYLGPEFTQIEIKEILKKYKEYRVTNPENINKTVAELLATGKIVARFAGRMEFGARALGNRSILADPRRLEVKHTINHMIKMRDFWMPFAPSILSEDATRYLLNPKKIAAPYMTLAFETTSQGQKDLAAAVHTFDKTVRPQILDNIANPAYYELIQEFKKMTGVGALLNTSFNIHGEPIVCSPQDALSTFKISGLTFLQLENVLISKQ